MSSGWSFARRHRRGHVLGAICGRLSHDRTTESLFLVEVDQAGAGDSPWVHSRRARRVAGTVGWSRRCRIGVGVQDDWGWSDLGPFLASRHLLFRGRSLRGVFVGGQLACRQVTPGKPGRGLPLRVYRGLGPVRASAHLSQVLTEAGVAPAVHLRGPAASAASPAQPVSESVLAELAVPIWAWGADTHGRT